METACDAMLGWREPARFKRCVCPLLVRNEKGLWVCSVDAEDVRPFWGRVFVIFGGGAAAVALLCGLLVFAGLRVIGYEITARQVFWPPAWNELAKARVELFVKQAGENLREGRVREAMRALTVANQLDPDHYAAAMMLAQLSRVGNPAAADRIYLRMSQQHPAHRNETARHWFVSMLAQGRLGDVAELARRQLATGEQTNAWMHALVFSCRMLNRFELMAAAASDPKVPAAARAVASLEVRVRALPTGQADRLVRSEPLPEKFPYARLHRAQLLVELGKAQDAIALLASGRNELAGRDLVPAALAAYAAAGDEAARGREIRLLLNPAATDAQVELVAVHLVRFPGSEYASALADAWSGLPKANTAQRHETTLAVLCALGAANDKAAFARVRTAALAAKDISSGAADRLHQFFFATAGRPPVEALLASMIALPLELNYAMLERFARPGGPRGPLLSSVRNRSP